MASQDAAMTKMIRSQIGRRSVDASLLDIRCIHGTVYFRGVLRTLRSAPDLDLEKEKGLISTVLRSKPGIREIIWEVTLRT